MLEQDTKLGLMLVFKMFGNLLETNLTDITNDLYLEEEILELFIYRGT